MLVLDATLLKNFWLCWVFVAAHSLCLVVASRGYSPVVVCGLLTALASFAMEHGLRSMGSGALSGCSYWALGRGLSSCGPWAELLPDIWNLPGPGIELTSLHWQANSQPLDHQESPDSTLNKVDFWLWISFVFETRFLSDLRAGR